MALVLKRPSSAKIMCGPFGWVSIPAGKVTLGGNMWANGGYHTKASTFEVKAFAISKYPVTTAQFGQFIAADGYGKRKWWTEAGWEACAKKGWTAPRSWVKGVSDHRDYPVSGVSWHEAVAFCAWLADQTGEAIRLPTEQEWQRAAQADTGWAYPYGDVFDKGRCNYNSKGITPVNQYEGKGDSPFGVVDMSGNVWEWCATDYETGAQDIHLDAHMRVLRGGSWWDEVADGLRADCRFGSDPHGDGGDVGFRLARC
jgi:formylglycine-generating enzyme required for sulfatase activity